MQPECGRIIKVTEVTFGALDRPTTISAVLFSSPRARLIVSLRGSEWI
jgi:hypothetical protein